MRQVLLASIALAIAAPAWAGPKDKTSNTLVDINAVGVISNANTKTKVKGKGCSLQAQMKPTSGLADGDIVICLADGTALGLGGNSIILAGEAKKDQVKIKADLTDIGCGSLDAVAYDANLRCFVDDGAYLATSALNNCSSPAVGSAEEECCNAGKIWIFNGNPEAKELKANPGVKIVHGGCQAIADNAFRLSGPTTPEFARFGQRAPLE